MSLGELGRTGSGIDKGFFFFTLCSFIDTILFSIRVISPDEVTLAMLCGQVPQYISVVNTSSPSSSSSLPVWPVVERLEPRTVVLAHSRVALTLHTRGIDTATPIDDVIVGSLVKEKKERKLILKYYCCCLATAMLLVVVVAACVRRSIRFARRELDHDQLRARRRRRCDAARCADAAARLGGAFQPMSGKKRGT